MEDKDVKILIRAAHAGGKVLRKYFGKNLDVVEKSTRVDYKTKADLESERQILKVLKKGLPEYNIFSEEEGETNKSSEYTLVIDPLDGTNNFVIGMPIFSISIALLRRNEIIAGVVYQPIINQTYHATKDKGAYLNNKKIKVNDVTDVKKATISYSCGYKIEIDYFNKVMTALYNTGCKRAMNNFSVAFELSLLASGKIESIINDGTELYDFAAGKIIALEAGAKIINFNGKKEKNNINDIFIIGNTDKINKKVLKAIKPLQGNKKFKSLTK
jgi:myo-inositol-1(or 4)-monophosphatase